METDDDSLGGHLALAPDGHVRVAEDAPAQPDDDDDGGDGNGDGGDYNLNIQ